MNSLTFSHESYNQNTIPYKVKLTTPLHETTCWKTHVVEDISWFLRFNQSFEKDDLTLCFFQSVEKACEVCINLLLDREPLLINSRWWFRGDYLYITPLHLATVLDLHHIRKLLLKKGADPKAVTQIKLRKWWSAVPKEMHKAYNCLEFRFNQLLEEAVSALGISYIRCCYLEKETMKWDFLKKININALLCSKGKETVLEYIVKKHSPFPCFPEHIRGDLVEKIACDRTEEVINFLLQIGANPRFPNPDGKSLLDWMRQKNDRITSNYLSDYFTKEYIQRIILTMEIASKRIYHQIAENILGYAEIAVNSEEHHHLILENFISIL